MEKPVLVVLAAGMGSRYGGLKQIDPIGPNGEIIIDYSVYDAIKAGFKKVVFIIKKEIEADFMSAVGERLNRNIEVAYAYQELDQLPQGFSVPEGRVKPWGTAHAILAVQPVVRGPFGVINADDYYGPSAFKTLHGFLSAMPEQETVPTFGMVGYHVENTVTENGSVARGVCQTDAGYLTDVVERLRIEKTEQAARFTEDDGATWKELAPGTLVSMNFWGFSTRFLDFCERDFPRFLEQNLAVNPMKCEFLLPSEVGGLIRRGEARVRVMESVDTWHGVTYQEDKPEIVRAIRKLHTDGVYPKELWP